MALKLLINMILEHDHDMTCINKNCNMYQNMIKNIFCLKSKKNLKNENYYYKTILLCFLNVLEKKITIT